MEMAGLSWKKPDFIYRPWVFWSHEQSQTISSSSSSGSIALANTRKITSELYNYEVPLYRGVPLYNYEGRGYGSLLIQFWAATKTDGGRCTLTTRDQPFALTEPEINLLLLEYRKLSLTYEFVVNDDEENQQLVGLPGRVFRNKWPESTPNVSYYSTTEYPQRESALNCDIWGCLTLPLFEPSGCDLLGVLQLAGSFVDFSEVFDDVVLEKITHLKCLRNPLKNILKPVSKEIQKVLEKVCDVHQLPLAQSWVLGNYSNTPAYNEIQENRDAMVVTNYAGRRENKWLNFSNACRKLWLKKDQGIVGKALLSHKLCFCKDITQLSMTDYPLVHYARDCRPVGCFTICLRNFITGNKNYVLEFFLPSLEMRSKDPQTLLNALLETLEDHIFTFKVASGEELGEELSVQVVKSSIHDESDFLKIGRRTTVVQNDDSSDDDYYTISSFKEFMQTRLSCGPSKLYKAIYKWVFLTEDDYPHIPTQSLSSSSFTGSIPEILGKRTEVIQMIAFALIDYYYVGNGDYLIQFWAPITYGRRCVLKTSGQPFALNKLHRGLCAYRKNSLSYEFLVEENGRVEEDQLGIIGRVFQHKWPESTPDVFYYTDKEHPQRNDAVRQSVKGSIAIPVFDSSGWSCVGVLEIVCTEVKAYIDVYLYEHYEHCAEIIKMANLRCPPLFATDKLNVLEGLELALNEINQVLKVVCKRHLLPLVQCWVRWSFNRAVEVCSSTRDFLVLACEEFCAEGTNMLEDSIFRKVQGLVGKTLLSRKPCFCRDITHLSLNEYPFLNYARHLKLTRCFTICLRSTSTGDEDYILEFFLPTCNNEESEDPQIFLDSLFATMKENFQSFKVASGEELGEELRVEVYKSFNDNEEESFRICQPKRSLSQPESLENEVEMMALDPSDQQLVVEDAIQHDGNVSGAEISDTTCTRETSEIKNKRTVKDISYEDLEQHFGRRLIDVAKSFGLSQSAFKRLCRRLGIGNWRDHKRKTADNSSSKLRRVGEELSCSGMPPVQSTSTVSHTSQDVYPVAVKATYKDVIIRFELSSSSGIAELQENVALCLQLERGNFSIRYQDDEGDWVLIALDNHLKTCIDISRSSKKTPIKMSIGPKYSP